MTRTQSEQASYALNFSGEECLRILDAMTFVENAICPSTRLEPSVFCHVGFVCRDTQVVFEFSVILVTYKHLLELFTFLTGAVEPDDAERRQPTSCFLYFKAVSDD